MASSTGLLNQLNNFKCVWDMVLRRPHLDVRWTTPFDIAPAVLKIAMPLMLHRINPIDHNSCNGVPENTDVNVRIFTSASVWNLSFADDHSARNCLLLLTILHFQVLPLFQTVQSKILL